MTKKTEVKEAEVVLTFGEKLQNQVDHLESESKKIEANFHQIQGALSLAKGLLDEYKSEK